CSHRICSAPRGASRPSFSSFASTAGRPARARDSAQPAKSRLPTALFSPGNRIPSSARPIDFIDIRTCSRWTTPIRRSTSQPDLILMSPGDWYVWVVFACAMCVPGLSQFRLHKTLLLEGVPARIVQWILLSIAAFGIANAAACHFDREAIGLAVALASPALHLLLFRVAFRWFVKTV